MIQEQYYPYPFSANILVLYSYIVFSSLNFNCENCNIIWKNEEPFENHLQQKHNKHICVRCNERIEGKENLDFHFSSKHRAF